MRVLLENFVPFLSPALLLLFSTYIRVLVTFVPALLLTKRLHAKSKEGSNAMYSGEKHLL